MRFILLLGAVFGAPTIRNYNIKDRLIEKRMYQNKNATLSVNNHEKTMMNGNGSGSIDVTAGDDTWQYEWPELNESVKTTVSLTRLDLHRIGAPDSSFK